MFFSPGRLPLALAGTLLGAAMAGLGLPMPAAAELSNGSLIGPGLRTRPAYDGSSTQRGELVPVVRYFGQPWFVRSTQGVLEGGARWELSPGLNLGAQLAYEPGRKNKESDFLNNRGLPDVDGGASVGVHAEWDHKFGPVPITLLARARQNIDSDRGAQFDLRLSVGIFQKGAFSAGVFTQGTWADSKSTGSLYGVTPSQSAVSGLPAFDARSGWMFAAFGFLWSYDVRDSPTASRGAVIDRATRPARTVPAQPWLISFRKGSRRGPSRGRSQGAGG
jgi:outer membrane protein